MRGVRASGKLREESMELEDLEPRKKVAAPRELDSLSIEELKEYIAQLEAEIERVKLKIAAKEDHLAGAAGLFKNS
jgi:uncharacterized small protein (DUF1192 family)